MKYDPQRIEAKWQEHWREQQTFRTPNPGDADFDPDKPRYYVLAMFPYPSGAGMHMGHALNYTSTDIIARYQRMRGYNVLHPIGYDAFGLPAEQYAIENNVHPRTTTENNIEIISRQLARLGLSFDWDRCFATTDVSYYRWTQWIFLQLYHSWFDPVADRARPIDELRHILEAGEAELGPDGELIFEGAIAGLEPISGGYPATYRWYDLTAEQQRHLLDEYRLAYLAEVPVNWCPALGTVLANEEVTAEGRSERGNHPVYQRPLKQWMLRITAYAERLLEDLELVDWPEPIKLMQTNWIGKSEGARIDFPLAYGTAENDEQVSVFTTRPDTIFGATYMVLAPEHPLVDQVTTAERYHEVNAYRKQAEAKSDADRQAEANEKSGVFTGGYALNPANDTRIPIWVADYVMMSYGTGAIMAVPAHDDRDFAFARQFELPIRPVVMPSDHWLESHAENLPADHPGRAGDADVGALRDAYREQAAVFGAAYTGEGHGLNSENQEVSLDDVETPRAKRRVIKWLEERGIGRGEVQYKLRDWLFSRQRYWGEPFPIVHSEDEPEGPLAVDAADLPVQLPDMPDFRPQATGDPDAPPQPPLSRAEHWRKAQGVVLNHTTRRAKLMPQMRTDEQVEYDGQWYPLQGFEREFNTMPQWAGSCWYYLRFLDPDNRSRFVDSEVERYWMEPTAETDDEEGNGCGGVDMYIGGVEHAVLHLLYARFWHKVLYDLGHVSTPEPFARLYNQGYIQANAYTDERGIYVPADEVEERDGRFYHQGKPVSQEFGKMGKSLKNSVSPDEVCEQYGADSLRLYLMYLGPLDQSRVWRGQDIVGLHRFLNRLWRNLVDEQTGELLVSDEPAAEALERRTHRTIERASGAMDSLSFNVAIASLIELNNELVALERVPRSVAETLVRLLAPLAPHIAEELWERLGHEPSVADAAWPVHDPAKLVEETIELPVQINGKLRSRITVASDADDAAIEQAAKADAKVAAELEDKAVRKVIVIRGRMVNIVAS